MDTLSAAARYDRAVTLLPQSLRARARELTLEQRAAVEELRLRASRPMTALLAEGELRLGDEAVTRRELDGLVDIATGASAYSARDSMRSGYITVRGGYRIGLCGSVLASDGRSAGFRSISSACIRIAREIRGVSDTVLPRLIEDGRVCSTLILSPPGGGKTTLLRDIVRAASDGDGRLGLSPTRVGVADERSEIAALLDGEAQLDVGAHTDVLDSCPRAEGIMMLLRAMNPELIAFDEITAEADAAAARTAAMCGAALIATAHAGSVSEVMEKPLYRGLFEDGIFRRAVFISRPGGAREYIVTDGALNAL